MTEKERYAKRRAYYKAYAAANRAKRREANRRWREKDRQCYNARQSANNRRLRGQVLPPAKATRLALLKSRLTALKQSKLRHETKVQEML